MISRIVPTLFLVAVSMFGAAQPFNDATPANLPAVESGDVAWADFNNDGYLDFAMIGRSGSGNFGGIYVGAGDGTFELLPFGNMPAMRNGDLDWGDFDDDGDLDLAITGRTDATPWQVLKVLRNNGTSFEEFFSASGAAGGSLTWFDYDNDGDLDLYQVGSSFDNWHPNSVFINSDGTFSVENTFGIKGYYSELDIDETVCIATDFDNDGDRDLFSSGKYSHGVWNEASLLVNHGVKDIANTAEYRFAYHDIAIRSGSVNQGDFNKDGLMDYFLTGNSSSINARNTPFSRLLFGTGNGNFLRRGSLLDVYNSSSDVGDIDNDGDLDILVSGETADGPLTRIYLNDGMGNFTDSGVTNLVGLRFCSVSLGDFDNDGDLDIVMIGRDQDNLHTTKLYRNDLRSGYPAPNERPAPPSNLRFKMENNSVILEWDAASDKETPSSSLTYNVYIAIASGKPFKMFPQAIAETGKRKVYEHGNTSLNTKWTVKGLKTGTYFFSVQSIDGANAGSEFAPEVAFNYTRIDAEGSSCLNSEQTFSVSPPSNYNWAISGGKIIGGQGSDRILVKWDEYPANPKITATANGSSNSLIPDMQFLPPASISGEAKVCDINSYTDYRAGVFSEDFTYLWNIDGLELGTAFPYFEWTSPGSKVITLTVTDTETGCKNSDTLAVAVSERIDVKVYTEKHKYKVQNARPSYKYIWERYLNNTWSTVGNKDTFIPQFPGYYRLTIINEYECSASYDFYVNEIITSIENEAGILQLLPNPATTSFKLVHLPATGKPANVSIFDLSGRSVFTTSTSGDSMEVDCSWMHPGIYIVVVDAGGKATHSKLVIE